MTISLSNCSGGILACSSLQCCFSSLRFVDICLCTPLLKSHHSISVRLRSGLWLGKCNILILVFFSHSVIDLLVCLGSLSYCTTQFWPSFSCRTDCLIFEFDSRILSSSWLTQRLQGAQVLWLQNKPKCPWGEFAGMPTPLGRPLAAVLNVFHLWIIFLTVE